ncbi:histidine-phosphotransfer domain, HPT domain-containing protein [Pholiota conissans]|uniref:Histidine-phosphotransfer domain, HPT domain-containing protein n=1 Tax=Pholiota conissans TaxID=109636 RepID=A0A9P5ZEB4_9AGAR|nr:histidine-phosphotransfer domain, HPT domain-containing protein [Pholiota conissans]
MDTFTQILELDEDEENHDFSQPMVWEYFEQAEKTFGDMDDALKQRDLNTLSGLGHFLKGSSAALGLSRVQDSCEKIQHLGHRLDGSRQLSDDEALAKITKMVKRVRIQYGEAQKWLKDFYGEVAL